MLAPSFSSLCISGLCHSFFFLIFIILLGIGEPCFSLLESCLIFSALCFFFNVKLLSLENHCLSLKLIPHIFNDLYFPDIDANPSSLEFTGFPTPPCHTRDGLCLNHKSQGGRASSSINSWQKRKGFHASGNHCKG